MELYAFTTSQWTTALLAYLIFVSPLMMTMQGIIIISTWPCHMTSSTLSVYIGTILFFYKKPGSNASSRRLLIVALILVLKVSQKCLKVGG